MTDLRSEAAKRDRRTIHRLDTLAPRLLNECGIDAWVISGREYNEDALITSMLPADWLSARRRTILVLARSGRWSVTRYDVGDMFPSAWDPDTQPDQLAGLVELLVDLDPASIAVGTAPIFGHADGLSHTEHQLLLGALPGRLANRIVSGEHLAVRWLETRLDEERPVLTSATRQAHDILRAGLSPLAITPGSTTTDDLVWWYRERVRDAGYTSWFQPSVSVQRATDDASPIIGRGDLVHVDFGIVYEGLCTDQQEHAYVLADGETDAPADLQRGLADAVAAQEIVLDEIRSGRTGNEILARSLARCGDAGFDATIYSHPIGLTGHGAGPTIGLWDAQEGVQGAGDHPVHPNTAYSVELSVSTEVTGWNGPVRIMVEQDAWFDGSSTTWLDGVQEAFHLI